MTHTTTMRIPTRGPLLSTSLGTTGLTESMGAVLEHPRLFVTAELFLDPCSVNLGGWFVLEPFISPALFQKYPGAVDEWTLSTLMAADTAGGGLAQLEEHYKTFIVSSEEFVPCSLRVLPL